MCAHCWNMHHVCGRIVALLIFKKLNLSNAVFAKWYMPNMATLDYTSRLSAVSLDSLQV